MKRVKTPSPSKTVAAGMLEELLVVPRAAAQTPGTGVVAEVVDDRHPSLVGRVAVRWQQGDTQVERWAPTLSGLAVRKGDRVLLQHPANWPEPIVVGVLDGYAQREPVPARECARVELRADEAVCLCDHRGRALVEIREGEHGPVVQLCADNLQLRIPGHLELDANSLHLRARAGSATVEAADDVVVRGETVHLN